MTGQQSRLVRILFQCAAAQFNSQLREYTVAGSGQSVVKIHGSVGIGTGDGIPTDDCAAGAAEGAPCHPLQLIQSGGGCDYLKHRARSKDRGEEAVDIHTVVPLVAVLDGRGVGGVKGGSGHHAKQLPCFVVVYPDGALAAAHSLVSCRLQPTVQSQIYPPASTRGAKEKIVANELFLKDPQCGGGDVPGFVAYGVEGGLPKFAVVNVCAARRVV